jgi:hypothetical protein
MLLFSKGFWSTTTDMIKNQKFMPPMTLTFACALPKGSLTLAMFSQAESQMG